MKRRCRVNVSKCGQVRGRVRSREQSGGRGRLSDEAGGLLLHVVLLVFLHPPADVEEQQRAQSLVAHLQAQVPVGQETGPVRGVEALWAASQWPGPGVLTTQGRIRAHPGGAALLIPFNPRTTGLAGSRQGVDVGLPVHCFSSLRPLEGQRNTADPAAWRVLLPSTARRGHLPVASWSAPLQAFYATPTPFPDPVLPPEAHSPCCFCLCDEAAGEVAGRGAKLSGAAAGCRLPLASARSRDGPPLSEQWEAGLASSSHSHGLSL